jgi:hypothetical protein
MTMKIKELLKNCTAEIEMLEWGDWEPMHQPTPARGKGVIGCRHPGVYHIRRRKTKEDVIAGTGDPVARRMRSWYTQEFASGKRRNQRKRIFLSDNWRDLEYRILRTSDIWEAKFIEGILLGRNSFLFNT